MEDILESNILIVPICVLQSIEISIYNLFKRTHIFKHNFEGLASYLLDEIGRLFR